MTAKLSQSHRWNLYSAANALGAAAAQTRAAMNAIRRGGDAEARRDLLEELDAAATLLDQHRAALYQEFDQ